MVEGAKVKEQQQQELQGLQGAATNPQDGMLEANQRLASQLLEVMFGRRGGDATGDQVANHLPQEAEHYKQEGVKVKQEPSDLSCSLALTPPAVVDEELMKTMVDMGSDEEASITGSSSAGSSSSTSQHAWDYEALGLELGMDLNVDFDYDAMAMRLGEESQGGRVDDGPLASLLDSLTY